MDLVDLDRLYWILIYWRGVTATIVVSSISSDWVCLFRAFVGEVAGTTCYNPGLERPGRGAGDTSQA